jgi:hypothetical protein
VSDIVVRSCDIHFSIPLAITDGPSQHKIVAKIAANTTADSAITPSAQSVHQSRYQAV